MPESVWTEELGQSELPFREATERHRLRVATDPRVIPNRRPAWSYAAGAAACLLACLVFRPWAFIFVWPAIGFCLLAWAYLAGGPGVFRKDSGRVPHIVRLLFAPYMIGNWVAYHLCRKRFPSRVAVGHEVSFGRLLNNVEADELVAQGLTAVLDLTAEYAECARFRDLGAEQRLSYKNVQILDLTLPTDRQITEAVEFVRRHARHGKVYIHCALGCCRAPSIAAGYVLAAGHAESGEEAVALVRRARPQASLPRGLAALLERHYGRTNR